MNKIVPTEELVLETEQCVEVALYMYEEWKKAMAPPVYAVYDFETWLHRLKQPITDLSNEPIN